MRLPKIKLPKRGQKGFTLIELLIVVAILGVLAAVIIPNVSRFLGRGEDEARKTELSTVQQAVVNMMIDNKLGNTIENPWSGLTPDFPTNDMGAFPDPDSVCETDKINDPSGDPYTAASDKNGFLLYGHDIVADAAATALVGYVDRQLTVYHYMCDADGTIHQYEFGTAMTTGGGANDELTYDT